jgi:hypothetical protein
LGYTNKQAFEAFKSEQNKPYFSSHSPETSEQASLIDFFGSF